MINLIQAYNKKYPKNYGVIVSQYESSMTFEFIFCLKLRTKLVRTNLDPKTWWKLSIYSHMILENVHNSCGIRGEKVGKWAKTEQVGFLIFLRCAFMENVMRSMVNAMTLKSGIYGWWGARQTPWGGGEFHAPENIYAFSRYQSPQALHLLSLKMKKIM